MPCSGEGVARCGVPSTGIRDTRVGVSSPMTRMYSSALLDIGIGAK